jgi:ABC-type lipoprotein export system ATPase subunit
MVTHNTELAEKTDRSIYLRDGMIEREVINAN